MRKPVGSLFRWPWERRGGEQQGKVIVGLLLRVMLALTVVWYPASPASVSRRSEPQPKGHVLTNYGKLPLHFQRCAEANCGSEPRRETFVSRGPGYSVLVAPTEAVLTLRKPQKPEVRSQKSEEKLIPRLLRPRSGQHAPDDNSRAVHPQIPQIFPIVIPRSVSDEGPALSSPSAKSADQNAVLRMKLAGAKSHNESEFVGRAFRQEQLLYRERPREVADQCSELCQGRV